MARLAALVPRPRAKQEILASPAHVEALNVLYDGEVQVADELVGRVLTQLEARGQLENSLVIVTSDHGQGLGENGNMGHGPTLREDVLHIPLIVNDFRSRLAGRRIAQTVSAVDLAPTIAAAALGTTLPGVQGRSLLPFLARKRSVPERDEVFAEVKLSRDLEAAPAWYDPEAMALYLDGLKFKTRRDELTVWDPGNPASSEKKLTAPSLDEAFVRCARARQTEFLAHEVQPEAVELTSEEIAALRSLGYLQ